MSDSDSDFSDNMDLLDQLIQEQNNKTAGASGLSTEKDKAKNENEESDESDNESNAEEEPSSDDQEERDDEEGEKEEESDEERSAEGDNSRPSVKKEEGSSESEKKLDREARYKQYMLERQLEEEKLRDLVFGSKDKLLKNIEILADGDTKEHREQLKRKREPVWADSDDEGEDIVTNANTKVAEIKRKEQYKKQLQSKFQRILGAPAWADLDREQKDDDSDDEILRTAGHLARTESVNLPRGILTFKRMKDLNRVGYAEGPSITGVEFHPTSTVSLVTGSRGVATIYSIDGKKNDKLHSMAFNSFPIRCCRFNHDGTEAIFGGSQKYFYTYNLLGGQTQRIFLPKTITKMTKFEVSPCGQYLALAGRFGEVHLLHTTTKELLCTVKQQTVATSLAFSNDSNLLFSHGKESEVNVFDIRKQQFIHRFIDEGCINGSSIAISPNGRLVAAGSKQGVVNIYNYSDVLSNKAPRPEKTILNLTTAISATKFNYTSEMLAIASKEVPDAVKLVHFPSGTVFSNFPGFQSNFGRPDVIQFSPQSGYLAIGNHSKQVALYRLKHFNNY